MSAAGGVGITVEVNGALRTATVEPRRLLADFLREDLSLTGTHLGCEHGVCGCCTVVFDGRSVRSCLMFAVQADGGAVQTVESLAPGEALHPLQQAFREHHALQCGFCTPGFLMTAHCLLSRNPRATDEDLRHALSGVLCRCTGYQNILRAVIAARDAMQDAPVDAQPTSAGDAAPSTREFQ